MSDPRSDPVGTAITEEAPDKLAAKAKGPRAPMFLLAILAGAFIAFGTIGMLVVQGTPEAAMGGASIL